ncbi:Purine nucleoside phosphorylase [Frankia canadensis]|uniref:Purine-nucleoside phosphorylase n=1 Tax=Frankia canadensis TaxID=1836972 RepID=A0A2I2KL48_9ACTN|nr:Purine nucleoside phosphorylase [Frankia canadensis]SOU53675.1 Purine nucleoside phosphorylase [Frankia canadensis]
MGEANVNHVTVNETDADDTTADGTIGSPTIVDGAVATDAIMDDAIVGGGLTDGALADGVSVPRPEPAGPGASDGNGESDAASSAARLAELTGATRHDVAIMLGSGWRPAADVLAAHADEVTEVSFAQLGGFPMGTQVPGHRPVARSVRVGDRRLLIFLGRVHAYEGHPLSQVVHAVHLSRAAGASAVVLTNAAGGLRDDLRIGQPVLIADHLNLTGRSPLVGAAFTDLTDAYSPRLRALARAVDPTLVEGVYAGLPGPHFETPAEIRMLRVLGADLVGMSTVHETIAARALGVEVLGLSLVTNLAAGMTGQPLDHLEVLAAGAAAAERMGVLLADVVTRI